MAQLQELKDGTWLLGCEFAERLSDGDLAALQACQQCEAGPCPDLPAGEQGDSPPADSAAPDTPADRQLARLCAAWPSLPGHTRAAILALVAAAC